MRQPFVLLSTLTVLLLSVGLSNLRAGELGKLTLANEPIRLLGGRLLVHLPAGAKVQPASSTLPATLASCQLADAAEIAAGGEKLVLVDRETFQLAGPELEKTLRDYLADWTKQSKIEYTLEPFKSADPRSSLTGFVAVPAKLKAAGDDAFVRGAFIVLPDKTVQYLEVYANAKAVADKEGCEKLAQAILASARAGDRKLQTAAGPRLLWARSPEHELAVELPEGFALAVREGSDALGYEIQKLAPFGQYPPNLSLFYGRYPRYAYKQEEQEVTASESEGQLLGKPTSWFAWSKKNDRGQIRLNLEARVFRPVPGEKAAFFVHVTLSADNEKDLAALKTVAESLKVVPAVNKLPASKPAADARPPQPAPPSDNGLLLPDE